MLSLFSIVVTGRNDGEHLDSLLRRLRMIDVTHELIYLDLDSQDESRRIARRYTDKVYLIDDMTWRRSSGRWAGAVMAEFDWILFLDADMLIQNEFVDFLNNRTYMHAEGNIGGYVGSYHLIRGDQRDSVNLLPNKPGSRRAIFEGALLVKKEKLLRAGNWMPSLYAHAHLDLRARLASVECYIEALPIPMVVRLNPLRSNMLRVLEEILPINRNYLGLGQMLVSQVAHRSLLHFIALTPWPWLLGAVLLIWLSIGEFWSTLLVLSLLAVMLLRRGARYIVTVIFGLIRTPFGMFAYSKRKPHYREG